MGTCAHNVVLDGAGGAPVVARAGTFGAEKRSLRRPLVLPFPPAIPILDPQITVRARDKDDEPIESILVDRA